jgi:tyrosyl-tRNA synthetase
VDLERKLELVRGIAEEIITERELRELFETKEHLIAYDGFEPSGVAPIHFGLLRSLLLKDLLKAGIHFKLLLADWFAWINNKMGGDLEKIRDVGKYFIEVWKAAGVDVKRVEVVWTSEMLDKEYWRKVILIAKNTTLKRANRCLTIMGRKEGEMKEVAQYFYPMMQCADIFQLKADITQLGLDQRKVNVLAREVGPKLGWWKPVVVSHHVLMGLEGLKKGEGFDESKKFDQEISSKMSKSKPQTCIYVHDSKEDILRKIKRAYCPLKKVEGNPILEYTREIIFRAFPEFKVERERSFGGDIIYNSHEEIEKDFRAGVLHPLDLKIAVARDLNKLIKPIREHFERNKKAKILYETVKKEEITR